MVRMAVVVIVVAAIQTEASWRHLKVERFFFGFRTFVANGWWIMSISGASRGSCHVGQHQILR